MIRGYLHSVALARQSFNGALCQIELLVLVSHRDLQASVPFLVLTHLAE